MALQSASFTGLSSVVAITTDSGSSNPAAGGNVLVNVLGGGSLVATMGFQGSNDGSNWISVAGYLVLASGILGPATLTLSNPGPSTVMIPSLGFAQIRVSLSAYTSGTATVQLDSSASNVPGLTNVNTEGIKATYSAAVAAAALATAGSELMQLVGSATKTVRVLRVGISGSITTTAQWTDVSVVRRSAAGTGQAAGTVPTVIIHDSGNGDAAATAVPAVFTTSPTALGALTNGGLIASARYPGVVTGTVPTFELKPVIFDFGTRNGRGIVLRGTGQILGVDVSASTLSNASNWSAWIEWTEE